MPLLTPPPPAHPTGDKRRLVIIVLAIGLMLAVVAACAALHPGGYGEGRPGCVTVTIPSTTGGALLHSCGPRARDMCQAAFAHHGRLSLLSRPACRAAGLH